MYQEFSIILLQQFLAEKKIEILATHDIDINSLKDTIIELYERQTRTSIIFDTDVDREKLILTLNDWPIPNSEYILSIKNLKSVTGEMLSSSFKRSIKFKSEIESIANIISPSMHEKIDTLNIELNEKLLNPNASLVNNFYIEISTDNSFVNIIKKTSFQKEKITLENIPFGQYFIRARVQQIIDDLIEYSKWSEIISFVFDNENENYDPVDPTDPDEGPIVDLIDFDITLSPEQGFTPSDFLFEFNKDLDPSSINVVIVRKDVK